MGNGTSKDNPQIRNLMLLWLVVTTEMGNNGKSYLNQLSDAADPVAAQAAQTDLAGKLGVSPGTVKQFVNMSNDPAYQAQFANLQDVFHTLVKAVLPADYDGPFCPSDIGSLVSLVPAA
jgi:hypothetical protein